MSTEIALVEMSCRLRQLENVMFLTTKVASVFIFVSSMSTAIMLMPEEPVDLKNRVNDLNVKQSQNEKLIVGLCLFIYTYTDVITKDTSEERCQKK